MKKEKEREISSKGCFNLRGCSLPLQAEQLLALIIELNQAGHDCARLGRHRKDGGSKHCIKLANEVKTLFEAAGLPHSLPGVAKIYPGPAPSFEPECPEAHELRQKLEARSDVQINWVKQKDKAGLVYKALIPRSHHSEKNAAIFARPLSIFPEASPRQQVL